MSDKWFVANNVERMYQILSAINLLVINAKLTLLKSENPLEIDELEQAKKHLLKFTNELSDLLKNADKREGQAILGTDPRMSQLASHFRHTMIQRSPSDNSVKVALDDLPNLLKAEDEPSLNVLIEYLDQLQSLVEQYSYSDTVAVFGEGWS